jgi:hypothetical protein
MEPNGDRAQPGRGLSRTHPRRLHIKLLNVRKPVCGPAWLTNGDGNRHAARWVAVTTTSARSERRTVVAVCGADAVGRRSGSPCQRVADAVAALRGRQARLSSTHLHVEATAGVLLDSCSSSAFGADADDRRCLYPPGCLLSVAAWAHGSTIREGS